MALSELAGVLGSFLARSPATFGCDQPRPFLTQHCSLITWFAEKACTSNDIFRENLNNGEWQTDSTPV